MKLYIQQKVFSWADRFSVKDETGQDRYYVEGELFSWGKKLHICNAMGDEAAYIQQRLMTFMPKYDIFTNGAQVAQITKEFSFLFPKYRIDGPDWTVEGSFLAHDYQILEQGRPIVTIAKEWMTWGDCYELDIENPADELIALAVVLTIDCVIANSNNNN